jgi:hypothetical protein
MRSHALLCRFFLALPIAILACNGNDITAPTTGSLQVPGVGGNRVWGTSARDVFVLSADQVLHGTP